METSTDQVIAFVLAAIWFVCAVVVVVLLQRWRRQAETWCKTEGAVTRTWVHSNAGTTTYYAAYAFTTPDGEQHGEGRTHEERQSGDVIDVWYDPQNPRQSKPTSTDMKTRSMMSVQMILAFLALGVLALLEGLSVIDLI